MLIKKYCAMSGTTNEMEVNITQEQLDKWQQGDELIQFALPHLSPDEREFLMTGMTPEVWDRLFNGKSEVAAEHAEAQGLKVIDIPLSKL